MTKSVQKTEIEHAQKKLEKHLREIEDILEVVDAIYNKGRMIGERLGGKHDDMTKEKKGKDGKNGEGKKTRKTDKENTENN